MSAKNRSDGLPATLTWRGQVYDVPALFQLNRWMMDGECETPEGEIVEPDHEDSWLSLLMFI
ncbi:hypothetical protein NIES2135_61400 (plasmid) [Leptolyngbya boryana NIES-2135]|uniref:Uncharacterized protein n=1 Tax=Leptolyngbya boryana NIES-2135 TaxID=1973484 RepID=A0A1Z4JRH7_LEPBY|nr:MULTISPECIES: hypothetical protein [Leptolyngbya]BAY59263.1 hypothetical protein NIES2135_61400 [Leptolyngbya boryana NIES-2135]MBD2372851.1 hypothetical protein [Leptolyngbya sp. FACHB-238]MBD2397396.1 hypothetical protein [Leptolyngbya sp. FACHB-239]MBD2403799.1 hypothetical protein [Leptolyngbya sp. FACHB-402]ULP33455.1 hypothetical protein MCP04_30465 [Leptolyngbya boryana IU 594]